MTRWDLSPAQRRWLLVALPVVVLDASNLADPLAGVLTLALVVAAVRIFVLATRRTFNKPAWWLLSASVISLSVADFINIGLPHFALEFSPRATAHVVLTHIGWVLSAMSLIVVRRRIPVTRTSSALDPWIAILALSMFGAEMFIAPILNTPTIPMDAKVNALALIAVRIWIMSEILRMWLKSGSVVSRAVNLYVIGFAVGQVAEAVAIAFGVRDLVANHATITTIPHSALQLLSLVIIVLAPLDPSLGTLPRSQASDSLDTSPSRVVGFIVVALAMPPLVLALHFSRHPGIESWLYLGWTLVLLTVVSIRIIGIVASFRGALERARRLGRTTDEMLTTMTMQGIESALPRWAHDLTGTPIHEVGVVPALGEEIRDAAEQQQQPSGDWFVQVPVPGSLPMCLQMRTPDALGVDTMASLTLFGQSLGQAVERIQLSQRVSAQQVADRMETLLANSTDVIAVVDERACITYVTAAITSLTAKAADDTLGVQWTELVVAAERERASLLLHEARRNGTARSELCFLSDPDVAYVECSIAWIESDRVYIVNHHDVTERHHLQLQLIDQAFHDALTGLANRALFRDRVGQALARSRRGSHQFAVMLLDLDDFKTVNDSLGHPAGDQLLRTVAHRLADCLRTGDTAARLGGDEFAVVLDSTASAHDAIRVAERILARINEPVDLGGTEVFIGASLGLAFGTATTTDTDELERNADLALYKAKNAGKNRLSVYEETMHGDAVSRLHLVHEMRQGIDAGDFVAWFQPIVELETGAVCGVEALARWHHREHGILEPDQFIPLAEDTGLIVPLGTDVMRQALDAVARWQHQHPQHAALSVTVNLSARQVIQEDLVQRMHQTMLGAGIDPATVVLEITESLLMPGAGAVIDRLRELGRTGVRIYIDDFGTGYSSLRYLRDLPVDGVKLARDFVVGLPAQDDMALARAVRDLSATLHLDDIVAEGIERPEQRAALSALGFRLGQGNLMAAAMDAEAMASFLERTPAAAWRTGQAAGFPSPSTPSVAAPAGASGLL